MPVGWRESRVQRAALTGIGALGALILAVIGRSLRWEVEGLSNLLFEGQGRPPIMAFWHGRVMAATYFFRQRGIVVMISENFSGEWIARIVRRFGYGTSRGSTARGGQRALLQLTRDMAGGRPAGFAVDGPCGPARTVQPGVVWLAKLTGNPIVPFHLEASRFWSFNTWDHTQVPKPFATVALAVGTPIDVPSDADDDTLEAKRSEVERALAHLEDRTKDLLH